LILAQDDRHSPGNRHERGSLLRWLGQSARDARRGTPPREVPRSPERACVRGCS
jgi:hypothetical protein